MNNIQVTIFCLQLVRSTPVTTYPSFHSYTISILFRLVSILASVS